VVSEVATRARHLNVAMITTAAMAALNVRPGSLPFARPTRRAADRTFQRTRANRRERPPAFAMQKVEGSSPFIRFKNPRKSGVFVAIMATWVPDVSQKRDPKLRPAQPSNTAHVAEPREKARATLHVQRLQRAGGPSRSRVRSAPSLPFRFGAGSAGSSGPPRVRTSCNFRTSPNVEQSG
jgi:hypothetical protein